jgi:hypothetical protein
MYLVPFGVVFLGVGIWLYLDQANFEAKAEKTTGTVIEVKRETSTSTKRNRRTTTTVYRPVIQFEAKGQSYTFTSSSASSSYNYPRGKRLDVLYDPANPNDARMADSIVSLIAIIFIGVGGLLFLVGLFLPSLIKGGGDSTLA